MPRTVRESEGRPVSLGPAEILVIFVIALLVFGPTGCPTSGARSGGRMREFRSSSIIDATSTICSITDDVTDARTRRSRHRRSRRSRRSTA